MLLEELYFLGWCFAHVRCNILLHAIRSLALTAAILLRPSESHLLPAQMEQGKSITGRRSHGLLAFFT